MTIAVISVLVLHYKLAFACSASASPATVEVVAGQPQVWDDFMSSSDTNDWIQWSACVLMGLGWQHLGG
jgi:hypothetical protein